MAKIFTAEMLKFIKQHAKGTPNEDMTTLVNREFGLSLTTGQIKSGKKNHNISSGLDGRFKKGNVSHNKGVKGLHYSPRTEFKKGARPVNYKPVGSTRVSVDGYHEIKVKDPNIWQLSHRVMWEQANGPVPKGHVVLFTDGNKDNLTLDNLMMISRAQLVTMNQKSLITPDANATKSGAMLAKLINTTNAAQALLKKGNFDKASHDTP